MQQQKGGKGHELSLYFNLWTESHKNKTPISSMGVFIVIVLLMNN